MTVTDMIGNFADACRALVPCLDRAEVPWQDHLQYDNFDRVVEPLFETLVTEPCEFAAVGEGRIKALKTVRYGFPVEQPDATTHAYIAVRTPDGAEWPFIQLRSEAEPFDSIEYGVQTDRLRMPLAGAAFAFLFTSPKGEALRIEVVDLQAE